MWTYNYSTELTHHGIKGQKWGVRRTKAQLGYKINKFKRKWNRKAAFKKLKKAEAAKAKMQPKKSVKDMTDEELDAAIARARKEDTYRALRPERVSKGKKFVNSLINDAIKPAAVNAGKKYVNDLFEKAVKDALDKKHPKQVDEFEKLRKEYNKLEIQRAIDELKRNQQLINKPFVIK